MKDLWDKYWIEITIGTIAALWFACMGVCFISGLLRGSLQP